MIRRLTGPIVAVVIAVALALYGTACSAPPPDEPDRVVVQHVLVSFDGKLPGKSIRRGEEEARLLALDILERANTGEDFGALVKEFTDDQHPGIYSMANHGVQPQGENEYRREDMVPGFGDMAFSLAPNAIGLCEFDGLSSPFGFHIIKRLQ